MASLENKIRVLAWAIESIGPKENTEDLIEFIHEDILDHVKMLESK